MPLADACVTEWRDGDNLTVLGRAKVPLADACVTEWRSLRRLVVLPNYTVPLADACVTEWRKFHLRACPKWSQCHSLMPVLLNGGIGYKVLTLLESVPLADACVTEWRLNNEGAAIVFESATR